MKQEMININANLLAEASLILGQRGSGKTVLLLETSQQAA